MHRRANDWTTSPALSPRCRSTGCRTTFPGVGAPATRWGWTRGYGDAGLPVGGDGDGDGDSRCGLGVWGWDERKAEVGEGKLERGELVYGRGDEDDTRRTTHGLFLSKPLCGCSREGRMDSSSSLWSTDGIFGFGGCGFRHVLHPHLPLPGDNPNPPPPVMAE